jgi:hypothetical protein
MSMLSDYIRHVVDPMEASYRATVESQRRRIADLEASLNAVRAEERARAAEVVRPFADAWDHGVKCSDLRIHTLGHRVDRALTIVRAKHLRRAAAYISDSQQFAENAKCSADNQGKEG